MFNATTRQAAVSLFVAFTALTLSGVASAEKIEQTYMKTNFRMVTKSSTMIDEAKGHEVGTEVTLSQITYSNPKFGTAQEMVYLNYDYVGGSGPHQGYYVDTYADGSQCYGSFEGRQKVVTGSDGAWEATWEGAYRYLGGTGKCKGLKGSGTYKGGASSTQAAKETGREVVEF